MKRLLFLLIIITTIITTPSIVFAQKMMDSTRSPQVGIQSDTPSDGHTAREETEGKEIWDKIQTKELECKNLTDDNFEVLGEYFMGQTTGNSHETMNNMMVRMMGKEGEEQTHIIMGKRMSGCEETKGGRNSMMYGWNNMMGGWGSFGFGWVAMLLFWLLLILGVVALIKWLITSGKTETSRTPIEILKERYAKGEIDKKEFEQMKKEIA